MDYDVIIVGGGPAGASAAIAAGRAGLSALVLEKAGRGRDKFCAGGVSYATRSRLAEMGAKEVEEAFEAEIDGYIVALPDGRALVGSLGSRVGATVRRSVFDAKLAEVAEALGAEVRWGSRAVAAEARGGSVEVRTADGQLLRGRYLIVATGAGDPLPERLGFPSWRRTDLGHCWGSEVPYDGSGLLARWRERYGVSPVLLLFGFMRYGYFWAFPKRAHLNLGVGTSLLESARGAHRRIFADCLSAAERAGLLEGVAARVDRSWLVPLRPRGWSPRNPRGVTWSAEKRALLVGDAAGLVNPVTGEGLLGAVVSGRLAAEAVKRALDGGDRPEELRWYEEAWWSELGRDYFVYGLRLTRLLYSSKLAQRLALLAVMADEGAVERLSYLLSGGEGACRRLYEYAAWRAPLMALKAALGRGPARGAAGSRS